jgi:hypothetical protein
MAKIFLINQNFNETKARKKLSIACTSHPIEWQNFYLALALPPAKPFPTGYLPAELLLPGQKIAGNYYHDWIC